MLALPNRLTIESQRTAPFRSKRVFSRTLEGRNQFVLISKILTRFHPDPLKGMGIPARPFKAGPGQEDFFGTLGLVAARFFGAARP